MSINYKDTDPAETNEWIESISDSLEHHGYERTRYLLESLINFAQKNGARLPFNTSTPYLNTILPNQQPDYPGDLEIEKNSILGVTGETLNLYLNDLGFEKDFMLPSVISEHDEL